MTLVIDPIAVHFHLVHDCIRGCLYVEHITSVGNRSNAWVSIGDMCYSETVICWNELFGTDSQQAHWKKLAAALPVPAGVKLEPFGMQWIVSKLNIREDDWRNYHKAMVEFRNNRVAHFDFGNRYDDRPSLTLALQSACLYREWLIELLKAYQATGRAIAIRETTTEQVLDVFRREIAAICQ